MNIIKRWNLKRSMEKDTRPEYVLFVHEKQYVFKDTKGNFKFATNKNYSVEQICAIYRIRGVVGE